MSQMLIEKIANYEPFMGAMQMAAAGNQYDLSRRARYANKASKLHDKAQKTTDVDKQSKYQHKIEKLDNKIRKIDTKNGIGYVPGQFQQQKTAAEEMANKIISQVKNPPKRQYTEEDFIRGREAIRKAKAEGREIHFSNDFTQQAIAWEKAKYPNAKNTGDEYLKIIKAHPEYLKQTRVIK